MLSHYNTVRCIQNESHKIPYNSYMKARYKVSLVSLRLYLIFCLCQYYVSCNIVIYWTMKYVYNIFVLCFVTAQSKKIKLGVCWCIWLTGTGSIIQSPCWHNISNGVLMVKSHNVNNYIYIYHITLHHIHDTVTMNNAAISCICSKSILQI